MTFVILPDDAAETAAYVARGIPPQVAAELVHASRHPKGLAEGLLAHRHMSPHVHGWLADKWEASISQNGWALSVDGMEWHRTEWYVWHPSLSRALGVVGFDVALRLLADKAKGSRVFSVVTPKEYEEAEEIRLRPVLDKIRRDMWGEKK